MIVLVLKEKLTMNESIMEFLNFDTNEEDLGISSDNFSQILLNANEANPRYTHTFGVRIFLLAGNISSVLGVYNEVNCVDFCY